MQKLLAAGVSSVAFLRNAFPKEAFKEGKSLGKVPIRLLKARNPIKEAGDLAAYVLSAMDALALKYLRELHLVIHENDSMNAVLEVYTFRFTYPDDGSILLEMGVERQGGRQVSQARIKEDTTSLLQALLDHTEGLPPLQDNCVITIDLSYYDKVPVDYQPKGFKDSEILQVPNGSKKLECGNVRTKHHALTVQVARVDSSRESLLGDREQQRCELGAGDELGAGGKGSGDEQGRQKRCALTEGCQRIENLSAEDMTITCVCGSKAGDPIMLKCTHCRLEEHGACYRVLEENETPSEHCCLQCALVVGDLVCTDPKLVKVYQKKGPDYVVHTCSCRRMLAVLWTEEFEDFHQLLERLGLEQDIDGDLLKKFSDEGVVSSADGAQLMIYQDQLILSLAKLFGGKIGKNRQ